MKLYGHKTVDEYISNCDTIADVDVIAGCLLDTLVLYHDTGIIEVFEETYLNEWSSAYVRHIYRKGLPKRFTKALEDSYIEEVAHEMGLLGKEVYTLGELEAITRETGCAMVDVMRCLRGA